MVTKNHGMDLRHMLPTCYVVNMTSVSTSDIYIGGKTEQTPL